MRVSAALADVERRLQSVEERIASIDRECAPPFYGNWTQQSRRVRAAAQRTYGALRDRASQESNEEIEYLLVQFETSMGTQEQYAQVLCGLYDDHQAQLDALKRARERDWFVLEEALASFRARVDSVVGEALQRFSGEHVEGDAFRVFRARDLATIGGGGVSDAIRQGELVSVRESGAAEEFLVSHLFARNGRVDFRRAEGSVREGGRNVYDVVGDFVVQWRRDDGHGGSEERPAWTYLSLVGSYAEEVLASECLRWLSDFDEFEGGFVDAMPPDVGQDVRRRMRMILRNVIGLSDVAAACRPGSRILSSRFRRAFDEVYDRSETEAQEFFGREYGRRFSRINWVGERIMDAIWLEDSLVGAAPQETIARWREEYDEEYAGREEQTDTAFRELERLRLANAATIAVAQEESRRLIAIASTEAAGRREQELVRLEGIREQVTATLRQAEIAAEMAGRAADLELEARMEEADLNFRARMVDAMTDLEKIIIANESKERIARIQSDAAIKKSRIERKTAIWSNAIQNIGGIDAAF